MSGCSTYQKNWQSKRRNNLHERNRERGRITNECKINSSELENTIVSVRIVELEPAADWLTVIDGWLQRIG